MTKTTDFTKVFQDVLASFPVDASAFQNAFKTQAAFGEKFSKVALEAAEKSTELSAIWAKETFSRLSDITKAKTDPADYTKAVTDFASKSAEAAAENLAAFAEIAKKVQVETVELLLAAGKEAQDDASAAVKKAAADVQSVAKKATAAAK
ncbi:Phasin [Paracoccus sp. IB05]|uniref:Phasin n=1 Tax=Paracoccus sp. IB05 TaxID=2779367 RepID=UPI0018E9088C|nr:Phasin [Paracoccus sp. IB05]MBJ2151549.1 Phasin [Paracoccus sp. IB05]